MNLSPLHERLHAIAGDWTYKRLAEVTGTNAETVRRYMQGQAPSTEFLAAICDELQASGEWLLTGRGPMRRADMRAHALREARASELLAAVAQSLESLTDRVERVERYIHTLEARLRGGGAFDGSISESKPAEDGAGRAASIASAIARAGDEARADRAGANGAGGAEPQRPRPNPG